MENQRKPRKKSILLESLKINPKYRIIMDESINYIPREERLNEIIWYECVPAYKGIIYLSCASPIELAFFSESIGKINSIEKQMENKIRVSKMDGEGIIYFALVDWKKMFKLAGAKTRRTISDEHKQKLAEAREKNKSK